MSFVSRLVTALLGVALIFLFWPIGVPIGFQQTWWARQQVITPVEPPPPDKRLFTKPDTTAPEPQKTTSAHAVNPQTPQAKQTVNSKPEVDAAAAPPPDQVKQEQTAALPESDEVAVTPPLASKRYYKVIVRDGGTIEANGVVIALAGISARDADAQCKDGRGRAWPCGARARTALMRLIRGRAVVCKVPGSGRHKALTARCSVGGTDLSSWMVSQGWAEPKEPKDPNLAKAEDTAREQKIGLWR